MSCWAEFYELYRNVQTEEIYKEVQAALSDFTKKTGRQAKCLEMCLNYPNGADTFDVWIEECGRYAFTICNYHRVVTVENFKDFLICRTAVKTIYKRLFDKYKEKK